MELRYIVQNEKIKSTFWDRIKFFFRGALYSYKALFAWLVPEVYILTKIVSPLFQILFFTYLGTYYAKDLGSAFFVIGNAVQISAISSVQGVAMTVASERTEGTLIQVLGTPASRIRIFVSRSLMHIIDGLSTVAIGFLFGFLVLGTDFSQVNFGLLILTLLITIFSTSGLGLLIGSFGLALREINLLSNLTYYLLLVLCGINYPLTRLPIFMQKIAHSVPLTRGVKAVRILMDGGKYSDIASLISGELIVGIIYITLGFVFFKVLDYYSRRTGKIEMY